jgi:hypothetical protein
LVEDVRRNGVREPIWLFEGKILDGRNRYRAARVAGVPCPTRFYEGDDPLGFVISLNLARSLRAPGLLRFHYSVIDPDRKQDKLFRFSVPFFRKGLLYFVFNPLAFD